MALTRTVLNTGVTTSSATRTTASVSFTAGELIVVIVSNGYYSGSGQVGAPTSVTWNGQSLTKGAEGHGAGGTGQNWFVSSIWYGIASSTASATVVVTCPASNSGIAVSVLKYTGHDATTPATGGTEVGAGEGGSTAVSRTLTTVADDEVLDALAYHSEYGGTATINGGQTSIYSNNGAFLGTRHSYETAVGTSTVVSYSKSYTWPFQYCALIIKAAVGGGAEHYTLTANQGSFSLSGQAATLRAARRLTAAQGSFALAGQDAGLSRIYKITAAQGSFTLTGNDAGLRAARLLTAAQGSFALTGQDAGLQRGYNIVASQASFALTGQDAVLRAARALSAAHGVFALTGQDAALRAARMLSAAQASFALTGQDAALRAARVLSAAHGVFALTGQDADLAYSAAGGYLLAADLGSFAMSGQDAILRVGRKLVAAQGAFALAGQDAGLAAGRKLAAAHGSFTLTGNDAALRAARRLVALHGEFALTGQDAGLLGPAPELVAETGYFVMTGGDAGLRVGRVLAATVGNVALTGQDAALRAARKLVALHGQFALTGQDANLTTAELYFFPDTEILYAPEPQDVFSVAAEERTLYALAHDDEPEALGEDKTLVAPNRRSP